MYYVTIHACVVGWKDSYSMIELNWICQTEWEILTSADQRHLCLSWLMFLRRFRAVVLEPFLFIPHTTVLKSNSSQAVQKDVLLKSLLFESFMAY